MILRENYEESHIRDLQHESRKDPQLIERALSIPTNRPASLDEMTKEEFDEKMAIGLKQAKAGEGVSENDYFDMLKKEIEKSYV